MKNISNSRKNQKLWLYLAVLLMFFSLSLSAQNQRVTGIVVDSYGNPLPGASIMVVGNQNVATITDIEGKFSLNVPQNAILTIRFIGYESRTINVGNNTQLQIELKENIQDLEEVVVTALGISREAKSLGYARQKINTESLQDTRDPNLLNSLTGKVAGVNFISNGGPLSSTRVEIRGNNSLTGNNQPLYVIDGVPILNMMGESGDIDYGNPAAAINPDDIESIEVLKGANASALYGSDAANGVILITTRKASKKPGLGVSYNYNMQFTYLREYPLYQDIYGTVGGFYVGSNEGTNYMGNTSKNGYSFDPSLPYGMYVYNWAGKNQRSWGLPMLGYDVVGRNNEIRSYSPAKDAITNMYGTGVSKTNNVSVEKVFNGAAIRFSYTGINYDGMLANFDNMNRHTFNLRTNADLAKWLSIDVSVNYQLENADNRDFKGDSNRNPMRAVMNMSRDAVLDELIPWKQDNGQPLSLSNGFYNPYWLLNELSNGDDRNWFRGNFTVNIKPIQGLNIRLRASADTQNKKGWKFDNYYTMWDIDGRYETFREGSTNYNYEGVATYNKRWKSISMSANAGASLQRNSWRKMTSIVDQLAAPDVKALSNNASILQGREQYSGKEKQSVFGMLSLGHKGIFVDGTFRNDWSSTLPRGNNSYFYISGSGSAVLTEIFPSIANKTLSFAKLRASIARVGNDTGFDRLIDGYSYGSLFRNDMAWFTGDATRKNPNLKPETTISKEIGAEVHLYKNRLTADVTYYSKTTKDQIVESNISYLSGYQRVVINSGEISNKGWEITLTGIPIKINKFEWRTIVNWSKNNSMVEALPDGIDQIQIGSGVYGVVSYAEVGKSYGALYANAFKRNEEGQILCSIEGLPKEAAEKEFVGSVQADWRGGWHNQFRLGNLGLSIMIDFQKGGKFFSQSAVMGAVDGQTVQSLEGRDAYLFSRKILGESEDERYGYLDPNYANSSEKYSQIYPDWAHPKGVVIGNCVYDSDVEGKEGMPVLGFVNPEQYWMHSVQRDITRFIYDASYVKLREITVSYDFPKKWLGKTPFQSVRLAGVGRNLATLFSNTPQGLDPQATSTTGNAQGFERGFNLPAATFGFDIKVSF